MLQVRQGERIALVGGGGKTSLAYRLLAESRQRGWSAVFTTTTKILAPEDEEDLLVIGEQELDLVALRRHLLGRGCSILAKERLTAWEQTPAGRRQKLGGFSPEELARLDEAIKPALLVVEADGSRHLPFKAPAAYEPVVPAEATLLVVVTGLSVLGRPLQSDWVHRPEQVARLAGLPLGAPVDTALVAAVLSHPQGGLKGLPPTARAVAVLTEATPGRLPAGRELARRLLSSERFERVLLTDLHDPAAEGEVWQRDSIGISRGDEEGSYPRVHAVVLAAGGAERMGQNKLLLPLGGKPLLAHAVDAALGSPAGMVWVVVGADAEAVRQSLGTRPVLYLLNEAWSEGQATSIRQAVAALQAQADGLLFLAGDMPFVPAEHLDRLVERFEAGAVAAWSEQDRTRRIPALFGRQAFPALLGLEGDVGGRRLVEVFPGATVPVLSAEALFDVDTPAAYQQARRMWVDLER